MLGGVPAKRKVAEEHVFFLAALLAFVTMPCFFVLHRVYNEGVGSGASKRRSACRMRARGRQHQR